MHVAQLFRPLILGKNDEIVEAALPNVSYGDRCSPKRACLGAVLDTKFAQQPMCKCLFQCGQHQRRISALQFSEEKMNMLRHDHVTDNCKLMTMANLLHHLEKEIAGTRCAEKGTALIATCRNKVGVSSAVGAVQVCRHWNDVT